MKRSSSVAALAEASRLTGFERERGHAKASDDRTVRPTGCRARGTPDPEFAIVIP